MKTVVKVEGLSKKYIIGKQRYGDLRETVNSWLGRSKQSIDEFWVLKDINFEVKEGEVLGIIGSNGAGKSTLLKILSRITPPTKGKITINGRVASLLEVGTGFHPELTGRENIFLNGSLLGMKKNEIKSKFDEIVDFSGIERFIDTPVKRYSSGMYVRLAFAVAAHLEPEILLVDEVLAVGDTEFQKKCLGKMKEVSNQGRTVIFISHDVGIIRKLCNRGIFIRDGSIAIDGGIDTVVGNYMKSVIDTTRLGIGNRSDYSGSGVLKIEGVEVFGSFGEVLTSGDDLKIELTYSTSIDLENVLFKIICKDMSGRIMFICSNRVSNGVFSVIPSKGKVCCSIPKIGLHVGSYIFDLYVKENLRDAYILPDAFSIEIVNGSFYTSGLLPERKGMLVDYEWSLINS